MGHKNKTSFENAEAISFYLSTDLYRISDFEGREFQIFTSKQCWQVGGFPHRFGRFLVIHGDFGARILLLGLFTP